MYIAGQDVSILNDRTSVLKCGVVVTSFCFILGAQDRLPFTASVRETAYDRAGGVLAQDTIVRAVRSDGSTVRVRSIEGPDKKTFAEQRYIVDLAASEEVAMMDLPRV